MKELTEILFWAKNLGHLPVHLSQEAVDKYIMLNGVSGNFCIHFTENPQESNRYFSESWSSNTKNFLVVNQDNVRLFNWHKDVKEETISAKSVMGNLNKFYQYLITKSHKSEKDVVPFVIDIFRQFRAFTEEAANPLQALNLLFVLLASLNDKDVDHLDIKKWGISAYNLPKGFNSYVDRFNQGIGNMIPDLNLILRHSAGAIFQEAQKEVLFFNKQLDLFGTFTGPMVTKEQIYSSIHYTPSFLARSIVENALLLINLKDLQNIKILDPACGSAEFLIEVLKQLKEKNYGGNITIHGFDTSDTAISTSKFLLAFEKRTIWKDRLTYSIKNVEDSLAIKWDNDYNLILMNPPFISWEQLKDKRKKDAVREVLGEHFMGRPNEASAFFYKSISHLAENGVLGTVIPTSVFSADYYQKLRHEVETIFTFKLVGKLGNFVFDEALTDISIVVGKKPKGASLPTILWTRNEKGIVHEALRELRKIQYAKESVVDRVDISIFQPSQFPILKDTWKPVSIKEHELIRNFSLHIAAEKLTTVNEIFDVQQGIRTGNNDVFKIPEETYLSFPKEERKYFRPVTDNDCILNGQVKIQNYVWYPYNKKGLMISTEQDFKENVPTFYKNILEYKLLLSQRARKNEDNWWHLSEHRAWQRVESTKLISTEFGNSSSFAFDIKGNYVVERGYAWQPRKRFAREDYYFYLSLFSSPLFDKLLSIYSKELAGGKWYDLGKKSTKNIPIPNVNLDDIRKGVPFGKMVMLGKRLHDGDSYVKAVINDVVSIYYPTDVS